MTHSEYPQFERAMAASAVMGVFRRADPHRAVELANAAWDLGVELVEIPVETPDAMLSLAAVREAGADRGKIVGAGTILDPDQARTAVALGAGFLVSPGTDALIHQTAADVGVPLIPGIATATEYLTARARGATWIKAFPASILGPDWFSAMLGPFPQARFVATGGVNPRNAEAFLKSGVRIVGIGAALADPRHAELMASLTHRFSRELGEDGSDPSSATGLGAAS